MDTPYNAALAAEIRAELARQQVTGREIARQTGLPDRSVARWLRGETPMTLDAMDAFARALRLSLVDLLVRSQAAAMAGAMSGSELPHVDSNHEPAGFRPLADVHPNDAFAQRTHHSPARRRRLPRCMHGWSHQSTSCPRPDQRITVRHSRSAQSAR